MGAQELLAKLADAGIHIEPAPGERLLLRPASRLTDQLRAAVRAEKPALLAVLRAMPPACPDPEVDSEALLRARRDRLLRWGWALAEAEAMAERLARLDFERAAEEVDDRVLCIECTHYRPGRCENHRRARLAHHDVGRDLATLLQRCPGHEAR